METHRNIIDSLTRKIFEEGKVSMDTFPFALSKEKYPWILFPEMKSYPFAERALVRPLRSEILQLDHRESKTLLFSFSNSHKTMISIISFPGKVSMDTFPGTRYMEKYPWILFPEMELYLIQEISIFRPVR